jgi:hypothetical protein
MQKMEKVLAHILTSPDFFPKDMNDDLQLNPNPYNFLRLFMAAHSHCVPDLSDRVIHRPTTMKHSQTLSQYALLWVHYFNDELNVNGVRYTKYRKMIYFLSGLPSKYSPLRKFLELEIIPPFDKEDNLPISLELHNLPSTIHSLSVLHGINLSAPSMGSNIHQVGDNVSQDDCHDTLPNDIKALNQHKPSVSFKEKSLPPVMSHKSSHLKSALRSGDNNVQCWLCDGAHSFRHCQDLQRMKSVCIKRPNVLKHFQRMLLNKNGDAIKILLDASEFFDEDSFLNELPKEQPTDDLNVDCDDDNIDHVKHLGTNDTDLSDFFTLQSPDHIMILHHDDTPLLHNTISAYTKIDLYFLDSRASSQ